MNNLISFRLPSNLNKVLDEIAKQNDTTRSSLIVDAIIYFLVNSDIGREYYLRGGKNEKKGNSDENIPIR